MWPYYLILHVTMSVCDMVALVVALLLVTLNKYGEAERGVVITRWPYTYHL